MITPRRPPFLLANTATPAPDMKREATSGKIVAKPVNLNTSMYTMKKRMVRDDPSSTEFEPNGKTVGTSSAGRELGMIFSEMPLNAGMSSPIMARRP